MSPEGSRIALDLTDETRDVWLLTLRDSTLTRLTFDNDGHDPTWMPDGRSVLYGTNRANGVGIHRRRIDGTGTADDRRKVACLNGARSRGHELRLQRARFRLRVVHDLLNSGDYGGRRAA